MRLRTGTLLLMLSFIGTVNAQELADEHSYVFVQEGLISPLQQKLLIEQLRASDPDARVSMKPQGGPVKVLTHVPLDLPAFIADAALMGVHLTHRPLDHAGRLEVGEQDQ
ncbi:MAG: hypothetical protein IPM49_15885 [Flavobacteriales bacterium]|nr:hypothetical protein [Flavobacteriales bacterium]